MKHLDDEALSQRGYELMQQGQVDTALVCFTIMANRYTDQAPARRRQLCASAFDNLGIIYFFMSNYARAYTNFARAVELGEGLRRCISLNNISSVYYYYDDFDNARRSLAESFDLAVSLSEWHTAMNALQNLMDLDCLVDSLQLSAPRMQQFMVLPIEPHDAEYHYTRLLCQGMTALDQGQYDEAKELFQASLPYADSLWMAGRHRVSSQMYVAKAYALQGRYGEALSHMSIAEQTARQNNYPEMLMDTYKAMADYYQRMGLNAEATESRYRYVELRDSVFNASEYGKIKDMQFFDQIDRYERQVERLGVENRFRTIIIWIVSVGLAVVLALLVLTYIQNRRLVRRNRDLYQRWQDLLRSEENERQMHQRLKESGDENGERRRYSGSQLSGEASRLLAERIRDVMYDSQVFCQTDFSLDELARLVGSNTTYVSQTLNETMQKSFSTYLNECRIGEACKRLADRDRYGALTFEAIGESVGFKSRSHFSRTFKSVTGLTPSVYQRMSRNEG